MTKKLLLSVLTYGLLFGITGLQAKSDTKTLMEQQINKHSQEQKQAPQEILEGIQATFNAVHLIEINKIDEAKKLLQKANNDFEKALKNNPELDLVPLEERLIAYSYMGSSADIKRVLDLGVKLLKDHDTQTAVAVLSPLKDELDINVVAIPMKLYPASTKTALQALNKGDDRAALSALSVGFGTLVKSQIIIPTPLIVAEELVGEASMLDKSQKDEAKALLSSAKEELKRAQLLGYTKKHNTDYKLLNNSIEKIEQEIKGKNSVIKLYEEIKEDFKKLLHRTRMEPVSVNNPAEKRVEEFQNLEAKKALQEKAVFKNEAHQDEKK